MKTRVQPGVFAALARYFGRERGNIAPLIAIMAVPIVAAFSIAAEAGSWWTFQRAQQNAADSAVLAAAIKGATSEGATVATNYGYTDGTNNATVSWNTNNVCPANVSTLVAGTTCYQVTISRKVPLYLTQIVGFREGTTVIGTTPAKTITATAIAGTIASTSAYCLGANGKIVMNGGGNTNSFQGCSMVAATSMKCTGGAAPGVLYGFSPQNPPQGGGVCGTPSTIPAYTDPYASRVTSSDSKLSCSTTQAGGTMNITQGVTNCSSGGDVTLPATTVTGANTIIRITNGSLTINGALKTSGSGTLTIVFDGAATTATKQNGLIKFSNGSSFDVASPASGDWANLAIAVLPALGQGQNCTSDVNGSGCPLDITIGGNYPFAMTGVVYDPNGTLNFNGNVGSASSSTDSCIILWGLNIVGNGNEGYGVPSPGKDCYKRDSGTSTLNVAALLQ